ncbi:NADH:ubiquinone reductase (Na(+)-transporting) subunit B [Desulfogranum mediterraneum]|uniref:NADH:ubiquinone reductase (Na(+)-transporting) subunit B n=1 Tax=Desulfogranum mediterraneum TaxID=160661 RepID=UPI00041C6E4D|nr:NADH:ubiquinone reductase (Na(+)-transporting) subunit B [Desulfogranum mediterraneum]
MSLLSDLFAQLGPKFEQGGPLERWYPLYEATDSFLFHSSRVTSTAPHVRDGVDYKRIMITVIIALIPCVVMALWNTGYQANSALTQLGIPLPGGWRGQVMALVGCDPDSLLSNFIHGGLYFLPIYLVTVLVGSIWECLFNVIRGHEMSEAFLVTSLLFPLTLPATIPLWQVALGISFGVIFAKEVFGGVGRNFMNPALVSRAFIFFAYPAQISGDRVWTAVDGFTGATPIASVAAAEPGGVMTKLGFSWSQAFLGTIPGSMGETSTLACLLGVALLLVSGIASWRIMLSMALGGLAMGLLFWLWPGGDNPLMELPPHYHLVMGGFAFGLTFMATDPVSAAQTRMGQWLYGGFIGCLAITIRVANPAYPEGVMLAILLGNVLAPLLDYFVIQANIKRRAIRHG